MMTHSDKNYLKKLELEIQQDSPTVSNNSQTRCKFLKNLRFV